MQRARHGQQPRHSHRSAASLRAASRRPRLVAMAGLVAAGLALAFWLPTRADTASASENGQHASSGQHRDWHHRKHHRYPGPAWPSASETAPTQPPTTAPTSDAPTSPPPSTTPPSTEPPVTTPPTTEPTTAPPPTTEPPTTEPPAPKVEPWAEFTNYEAGDLVKFKGDTYEVLAAHTSLPGWEPTALPALFKLVG